MADSTNMRRKFLSEQDGKGYRKQVAERTQNIIEQMFALLPSNYRSSIVGPNYSIYLKALSQEFAKFFIELEAVGQDMNLDTSRPEFLYQIFGYLLKVDAQLALNTFSDVEFRRFLRSLITLYFGGSTPANIKKGIELFTMAPVVVRESFLEDRDSDNQALDISDQFGFTVEFEITDNMPANFQITEDRIVALVNLIKPAHTLFTSVIVFKEDYELRGNMLDGTEVGETYLLPMKPGYPNMFLPQYDDFRLYFQGASGVQRLGFKEQKKVTNEPVQLSVTGAIFTKYGPLVKWSGAAQSPADLFLTAGVADVSLKVNGVTSPISAIDPIAGYVVPTTMPPVGATLELSYTWFPKPQIQMRSDVISHVLDANEFTTRHPVQFYLDAPYTPEPALYSHSFRGLDRRYTAGLDDETTLLTDEMVWKPETNGRASVFSMVTDQYGFVQSFDVGSVDPNDLGVTLNDETTIQEYSLVGNGAIGPSTGPSAWYSNLTVTSVLVEGVTGVLSLMDDSLDAIEVGFGVPATAVGIAPAGNMFAAFYPTAPAVDEIYAGITNDPNDGFFHFYAGGKYLTGVGQQPYIPVTFKLYEHPTAYAPQFDFDRTQLVQSDYRLTAPTGFRINWSLTGTGVIPTGYYPVHYLPLGVTSTALPPSNTPETVYSLGPTEPENRLPLGIDPTGFTLYRTTGGSVRSFGEYATGVHREYVARPRDAGAVAMLYRPAGFWSPGVFLLSNWVYYSPGVYGVTGSYFYTTDAPADPAFVTPVNDHLLDDTDITSYPDTWDIRLLIDPTGPSNEFGPTSPYAGEVFV